MRKYIDKISHFLNKEPRKKSIIIFFFFMTVLYLIPIWSFKYMPFEDGPNHLLGVNIINNFGNQTFNYDDNFRISFSIFKPYALYFFIMIFLTKFFSLLIAEKIFLSTYIVIFVTSFFLVAKEELKDNLFISSIVFIFIYNLIMFMGFYPYLISIPIFFFTLAYYQKNQDLKTIKKVTLLNFLLLLLFFSHVASLAVFLITIFILDFVKHRTIKSIFVLGFKILPVLAFLLYASLLYSRSNSFEPFYSSISEKLHLFSKYFNYNEILNKHLSLYYFIIFLTIIVLLKTVVKKPSLQDLKFFIVGLVMFIFFLLLPESINNTAAWVSIRVLPYFLLLGVLSLKGKINHLFPKLYLFSVFVLSIVIIINCFNFFRKENKVLDTYLSGIEFVNNNSKILPLNPKTKGWTYHMLLEAWAYYLIKKGGVSPYSFAHISHYPIEYIHKLDKTYLPNPGEDSLDNINRTMILYYDYVFLTAEDEQVENIMNSCPFDKVYKNNILTIWKKR